MTIGAPDQASGGGRRGSSRFQVLALDGGGFKGIFSAAIMAALEEDAQSCLSDHFDLITGTSTGGILALALGMGLRPRELVEFYAREGPRIFRHGTRFGKQLRQWHRAKYDQDGLREALVNTFGETLLGQSCKRLVIPSFNLDDDQVYIFKTPHHETFRRDWRVPMWQVALATSAAPTYFPASTHVGGVRHVDGGLWANNPILVGLTEAITFCGAHLSDIRILSLGTTTPVDHRPEFLNVGGRLQWATNAVDLIMKAQSQSATDIARHLLGNNAVCRLDPPVQKGRFALDRVSPQGLIARGHSESRKLMPDCAPFFQHTAAPYEPIYPPDGAFRS